MKILEIEEKEKNTIYLTSWQLYEKIYLKVRNNTKQNGEEDIKEKYRLSQGRMNNNNNNNIKEFEERITEHEEKDIIAIQKYHEKNQRNTWK